MVTDRLTHIARAMFPSSCGVGVIVDAPASAASCGVTLGAELRCIGHDTLWERHWAGSQWLRDGYGPISGFLQCRRCRRVRRSAPRSPGCARACHRHRCRHAAKLPVRQAAHRREPPTQDQQANDSFRANDRAAAGSHASPHRPRSRNQGHHGLRCPATSAATPPTRSSCRHPRKLPAPRGRAARVDLQLRNRPAK